MNENTCIWYANDGYDIKNNNINGRRFVGASFLKGWFKHSGVDIFRAVSHNKKGLQEFALAAEPYQNGRIAEGRLLHDMRGGENWSSIFFPAPAISDEAWRRASISSDQFSICGMTHTCSTREFKKILWDLKICPIEPWDALICTSHAVKHLVETQFGMFDEYINAQFGGKTKEILLPIIPLGMNTDEFHEDIKIRNDFRNLLNIEENAIVSLIISRLTAELKFDPFPLYLAVERAQAKSKVPLVLIFCGFFYDKKSQEIFLEGAKTLAPNVTIHFIDGKDMKLKNAALNGSDIFLFPIDNVQESFGLAPLEGMNAGLPIIATDWDGLKDTVTEDVGFRAPTIFASSKSSENLTIPYQISSLSEMQYHNACSMLTFIDIDYFAEKIALLANDPVLRKKMGKAGKKRVKEFYDWKVVIPLMQELFAEQRRIREHSINEGHSKKLTLPFYSNPAQLFEKFPTKLGLPNATILVKRKDADIQKISTLFTIRQYSRLGTTPSNLSNYKLVFEAIDQVCTLEELSRKMNLPVHIIETNVIWLAKMGFVDLDHYMD